jgi:alpha-L-fucosidase
MIRKTILLSSLLVLLIGNETIKAQNKAEQEKMQWFADAKLGIFIHWGIYSVNGISESWSFFNNYINYKDYMDQLKGFRAGNYNPQSWVDLIKESGARYAVLTSRHHDGVSLWNTKQSGAISIPRNSAARKDVMTPFISALKKSGLKTGIYYSLPDWSHNDYDVFTGAIKRFNVKDDPQRFERFINYYQGQLRELSQQYKPDLIWFDGDWEHNAEEWRAAETRKLLQSYNTNIIINSRLKEYGDYATPEQGVPVQKPSSPYWELCYTMNDSWGYQPFDRNYKTPYMLINTLVDCISLGGNLLLDIGPKADGTIPAEQVTILKEMGRWTKKHAEAVYGAQAGIAQKHFAGKTALSLDRKTLYLYLNNSQNGLALLKGILTPVDRITMVGSNVRLSYKKEDNNYWISVPQDLLDPQITVIKVQFEKPLVPAGETGHFSDDYLMSRKEPANQIIKRLSEDVASGNNPLSNKGLDVNKPLTNKEVYNREVLDWVNKHAETIGSAKKGLSEGHYAGLSALSPDKKTIYLFVEGKSNVPIALKGINNNIARIRIVGEGTLLSYRLFDKLYWSDKPGIVYIDLPPERMDKNGTIVSVLLDGPVSEYQGEVKAVESNL